ncbi:MAG: CapA family protein, partial [Spirochaetia bacterium]
MDLNQAGVRPVSGGVPARGDSTESISLFLCGDVMTGRGIDQVLPHPGDPTLHEPYMKSAEGYVRIAERANGPIPRPVEFDYIWGDALSELDRSAPDLRIINLETSITDNDEYRPDKGIHYRMHPDNTPCLTAADIDLCVLANNHVFDWGYGGLTETLVSLSRHRIRRVGAGESVSEASDPAVFHIPGKGRVIVFAAGHGSSGIPPQWAAGGDRAGVNYLSGLSDREIDSIKERIEAVKLPGDVVIFSIHWGGNWGYRIPSGRRRFARDLIDRAGADVVHGHSSHHPLGIEVHNGKLILYGCGD